MHEDPRILHEHSVLESEEGFRCSPAHIRYIATSMNQEAPINASQLVGILQSTGIRRMLDLVPLQKGISTAFEYGDNTDTHLP